MKKFFIGLIIVILTFFLITNGYADYILNKIYRPNEKINEEDAEISMQALLARSKSNITNIALFGVDNDYNDQSSLSEARSDAMKIVSLDKKGKTIKITSVERDLVVYLPSDYKQYGHFNWAYSYGGPVLAVQTLNYNLDMDITQYVTFSFGALSRLVDLLGGVDIELTNAEINQTKQPLNIYGGAGVYTLNGDQALRYCRIRYIDSDFQRMDRQNNVINAVIKKLKNENIASLMNIVNEMLPYISTNLTNNQIKTYLIDLLTYDLDNMETYKAPMGEYEDVCLCPSLGGYLVRSYSDMVIELHKNIYNIDDYKPSDIIYENEERTYATFGNFYK